MIITSTECNIISITSPWFFEWLSEFPNNSFTLKLKINHNSEVRELELNQLNINSQDPYNVNLTTGEGVYSLELIREENNIFETDYKCYFQECDLACEVAESLSKGCKSTFRYLQFLRSINLCDECKCKYAFTAYDALKNNLKKPILNDTFNDCGCN